VWVRRNKGGQLRASVLIPAARVWRRGGERNAFRRARRKLLKRAHFRQGAPGGKAANRFKRGNRRLASNFQLPRQEAKCSSILIGSLSRYPRKKGSTKGSSSKRSRR